MSKRGFTLIELLVVIAIVSLLSSVVLASLGQAREKAKIAKVKAELVQIRTAMYLFLDEKGELPPFGEPINNCSACNGDTPPYPKCGTGAVSAVWPKVMDELIPAGNKYLSTRIDTDPWGNVYCYDNNYKDNTKCAIPSVLWSMGPNGDRDTPQEPGAAGFLDDDIGILIYSPQC